MKIPPSLLSLQPSVIFCLIAVVLVLNGIAVHRNGMALHETQSVAVRAYEKKLDVEEQGLLRDRMANADQKLLTILLANLLGVCLSLLLCCIAWLLIDRQVYRCRE